MKKAKYYDIIAISVFIVLASVVVFMATNMLMSDVANYENGFSGKLVISTIPFFVFVVEIISFLIFFVRYLNRSQIYRNSQIRSYSIQFVVHSFIGIVTTILAGTLVYGSFLAPYPFSGALIIALIVHILFFSFSLFVAIYMGVHRLPEEERYVYGFSHVFMTILWAVFAFFALNKLGAFFYSFFYMDYQYFWFTIIFYISLLSPALILLYLTLVKLGMKATNFKKQEIIVWSNLLSLGLIGAIYTTIVGSQNPLLVSLISPAMPIERLLTIPVEAILLYGVSIIVPAAMSIKALAKKN